MSNFALMFLLSYALCIYGTFFKDITWGICLYMMQYWLNAQTRWWYGALPDVRWSFTISICILMAYIIKAGKYSNNRLSDVPQTKWFALNLMASIIINSWAVWPEMHSKFLDAYIKLLIFIFLTYKTIDTPQKFDAVMLTNMAGGFYVAHETRSKGRNQDGRVEGTGPVDAGGDGNNCAGSLITLMPMILYFVVKSHLEKAKLWKRLLLLLVLAFVGQSIVLINSRGAFIGLVLSCTYMGSYVFFNKKVTMKQRAQLIGVVMLGICAFLALADDTFWERMNSISEESESDTGGGGRKLFWKIAANEVVRDYPMGVGGWGFAYLSPHYVPAEFMPRNASMRAEHSLYFQTLVERGYWASPIVAGLILCNFLFMRKIKKHLFKKGDFSAYFQGLALESGFIAFLIAAAFLNRLNCEILYWQPMFFACFGNIYLIKGYTKLGEKKK